MGVLVSNDGYGPEHEHEGGKLHYGLILKMISWVHFKNEDMVDASSCPAIHIKPAKKNGDEDQKEASKEPYRHPLWFFPLRATSIVIGIIP